MKIIRPLLGICLLVTCANLGLAQRNRPTVCSQAAFAAYKPLPGLEYECPAGSDSDEALMKLPARLAAIRLIEKVLQTFDNAAWWNADAEQLNYCEIHGRAGRLTNEEKQKLTDGDYDLKVFGNHEMRLIMLRDPCYATGYSGANGFLLYRRAGKVFVSQVLNGYASRVANSVGIDFATLNGEQLIEISTANSFPLAADNQEYPFGDAFNFWAWPVTLDIRKISAPGESVPAFAIARVSLSFHAMLST